MTDPDSYTMIVDTPRADLLRLTLQDGSGRTVDTADTPIEGYVDNLLLTAVDNLLKRNSIDRFALSAVLAGAGVDKNTSFHRIVDSLAAALAATQERR